jgi:hypothetical protein
MTTKIDGTTGVDQIQDGAVSTSAKLGSSVVTPPKTSGLVVTQANQTPLPVVNTQFSFAHGLGVVPVSAHFELVCLTAEYGYVAGDVFALPLYTTGSYWAPFLTWANATTVGTIGPSGANWVVPHKTTGVGNVATPANWAWRFKARAA